MLVAPIGCPGPVRKRAECPHLSGRHLGRNMTGACAYRRVGARLFGPAHHVVSVPTVRLSTAGWFAWPVYLSRHVVPRTRASACRGRVPKRGGIRLSRLGACLQGRREPWRAASRAQSRRAESRGSESANCITLSDGGARGERTPSRLIEICTAPSARWWSYRAAPSWSLCRADQGFKSSWPVEGKPRIVTGRQRAAFGHCHARVLCGGGADGARGRRPVGMPRAASAGGVTGWPVRPC
jgi:hypothetical protein